MSALAQSNIVQYLTDYAYGIGGESIDPTAQLLAPVTQVASPVGKYKKFDDKNAFQTPATDRALGGPARRLEFAASDADYNCKPQALEIGIDDAELSGGDPLAIQQMKTRLVVLAAARAHARKVIDVAAAGVGTNAVTWSTGSTALTNVNTGIETILKATGELPTDLLLGFGAWKYFVKNAEVTGLFKSGVLTPDLIQNARLFLAPSLRLTVSSLVYDTTKPGVTKSSDLMLGSDAYLFISSPQPSLYDPSFMKTFRTRTGGVEAVRMYRDERTRSDIIAVDWTEDVQVVSTAGVYRMTVS